MPPLFNGGTWAILLAAGESRRMGQLKALLPWRGSTLVEHQIDQLLAAGVRRVVLVAGHQAERLQRVADAREGADWVLNPDYRQGKTTSIKAGVARLKGVDAGEVLLLNVDQPRSAETVRQLIAGHHAQGKRITIPRFQGKGGHPIIFSASLLPELAEIDEESLGIKAVVGRHTEDVARVDIDDPEVLWDLNTPEQYHQALSTSG